MQTYKEQLPNLDSLIIFDAVARHESFTEAAFELALTQPAVSQRIKLLEQNMGVTLFERFHKSIRLTQRGNEFHNSVVIALNHLVAASETVKVTGGNPKLRITADVAFLGCWLKPRLKQLSQVFPGIDFDVIATDDPDSYHDPSSDLAILHGSGQWTGHRVNLLFLEEVFPVCSPSYIEEHGPMSSVADLQHARLIDLLYEKWTWMNWTIWLSEMGVPYTNVVRTLRSNHYETTIEAARDGLGVALGWRHFVDEGLRDGTLVTPFSESIKTSNGYYLLTTGNRKENELITAVSDWLRSQVKSDS